ncbi:MAG: LEA type 2 family protein [Candidatus Thiodiazotropha sp. (ex Monitilora ramsayi)]|nr:LEA type 2 family protein [Candidatus Thiodiazotropha sp. (ex Monitilora ramsayi)]
MSRIPLPILVLILFAVSGCATLEQVGQVLEGQTPTAEVKGLRLTQLDFSGVDLAFDVQVDNPNPVGISLSGLDYDLKLLGSRFLTGEQPMGLQVAANGSSPVAVPVRLEFQQLMTAYQQLKHADKAGYQLDLGLGFDVPVLGSLRVPVSYNGELPIPKMPDLKVRSLDVQQLSMSGAKLLMQLEVDNPNAFSLFLNQLDYDLKLNGFQVGGGQITRPVDLKQDGQGVISLPLTLDFAQAGMGLYKALLGDGIQYDLNGSMSASGSNPILSGFSMPLNKKGTVGLK